MEVINSLLLYILQNILFWFGTISNFGFEINFWYVLSYLKGIQDAGIFVSTVFSILIFLGQTFRVYHSYNGGLWSPPQRACLRHEMSG